MTLSAVAFFAGLFMESTVMYLCASHKWKEQPIAPVLSKRQAEQPLHAVHSSFFGTVCNCGHKPEVEEMDLKLCNNNEKTLVHSSPHLFIVLPLVPSCCVNMKGF